MKEITIMGMIMITAMSAVIEKKAEKRPPVFD